MRFLLWLLFAALSLFVIFLPWIFLYGLDRFLWG